MPNDPDENDFSSLRDNGISPSGDIPDSAFLKKVDSDLEVIEEVKSLLEHSVTEPKNQDSVRSDPSAAAETPGGAAGATGAAAGRQGQNGQQNAQSGKPGAGAPRQGAKSQPGKPGGGATGATGAAAAGRQGQQGQQSAQPGKPGAGAAQQGAKPPARKPGGAAGAVGTAAAAGRQGQQGQQGAQPPARKPGGAAPTDRQGVSPVPADGEDGPLIDNDTAASGDDQQIRTFDISPSGRLTERDDPELDAGSAKFKVKFDFESAYRDVPEHRPLRLRRERRTGCIGGILYAAFVISVSLILASLIWMCVVDVLGFGVEDEQINVTVKQGFSIEDVTDMLFDVGLIKYKLLFNLYASYSNAEDKITAGTYILNMNFDYRALVQGMTARAGERVETTVTIPEGYTLAQIFTLLVDYGVCLTTDELWEAAKNHDFKFSFLDKETLGDDHRLEGFLFPETYNFYLGSTPAQAILKFLNEFNRRFTEQYTERAEVMGYSVQEIITIASMIEREAGDDDERPRIAAVIYNRLNSADFPFLQIDATIHYAIAGTGRTFSTEIDSPYNTYMNEDLPPGPISNPGMASIRAALYPESTNEYYYALNRFGTHNFFRTLAQHQAFVQSDEYGG